MSVANMISWVQSQIRIEIKNLKNDMKDGRVFAALLHHFAPSSVDYHSMVFTPELAEQNLEMVFLAAEGLGIPKLLDGEDICVYPDDKSIYTYLQRWYGKWGDNVLATTQPSLQRRSSQTLTPSEELRRKRAEEASKQALNVTVEEITLPSRQVRSSPISQPSRQEVEKKIEMLKQDALKEVEEMKKKAEDERRRIVSEAESLKAIALVDAEKQKTEILQKAKKEAEELTSNINLHEERSRSILDAATKTADSIISAAEAKAERIVRDATKQAEEIRTQKPPSPSKDEEPRSQSWSSFFLSALLGASLASGVFYVLHKK